MSISTVVQDLLAKATPTVRTALVTIKEVEGLDHSWVRTHDKNKSVSTTVRCAIQYEDTGEVVVRDLKSWARMADLDNTENPDIAAFHALADMRPGLLYKVSGFDKHESWTSAEGRSFSKTVFQPTAIEEVEA
jgi:hypothetical protein